MNPIAVENSNSAPALDISAATSNTTTTQTHNNEASISSYAPINEDGSRSGTMSLGGNSEGSYHNAPACGGSNTTNSNRSVHSLQRSHLISGRDVLSRGDASGNIALLEIPEEVYRVRRAALQVLKPLTRTWVSRYFFVREIKRLSPTLLGIFPHFLLFIPLMVFLFVSILNQYK
jgi:hypothetical protein